MQKHTGFLWLVSWWVILASQTVIKAPLDYGFYKISVLGNNFTELFVWIIVVIFIVVKHTFHADVSQVVHNNIFQIINLIYHLNSFNF